MASEPWLCPPYGRALGAGRSGVAPMGALLLQRHIAVAGADARYQGPPLRVGTDCSGLEAPVLPLEALRIPHCHVFSSEACGIKRRHIEA